MPVEKKDEKKELSTKSKAVSLEDNALHYKCIF